MSDALVVGLFALIGTLTGGLVSVVVVKTQVAGQLSQLREQFKTEFVAEETARHFLGHKRHIYRSFAVLQRYLGGFSEDELRRILVRAGAVRVYRKSDRAEMWYLLSRSREIADKARREAEEKLADDDD